MSELDDLELEKLVEILGKVAQLPDPMPEVFPPLEEEG
jgi:hypothetical protein